MSRHTCGRRKSADQSLTIYSGRDRIGTIDQLAGEFVAVTIDGRKLGSFRSLREATAAFDAEASA
jgi:hypothetical protein